MSVIQPTARPSVQVSSKNEADHRRQIAQGVNRALRGQLNCTLFVTLDASASSTAVIDSRISSQTGLLFQPQTANAAAEVPTLYAVCTNGSATIYHSKNAKTDRVFTMGMIG